MATASRAHAARHSLASSLGLRIGIAGNASVNDGRRGGGRAETGDRRRETGDRRRETGDGETGDRRRETGDGRLGDWRRGTGDRRRGDRSPVSGPASLV